MTHRTLDRRFRRIASTILSNSSATQEATKTPPRLRRSRPDPVEVLKHPKPHILEVSRPADSLPLETVNLSFRKRDRCAFPPDRTGIYRHPQPSGVLSPKFSDAPALATAPTCRHQPLKTAT